MVCEPCGEMLYANTFLRSCPYCMSISTMQMHNKALEAKAPNLDRNQLIELTQRANYVLQKGHEYTEVYRDGTLFQEGYGAQVNKVFDYMRSVAILGELSLRGDLKEMVNEEPLSPGGKADADDTGLKTDPVEQGGDGGIMGTKEPDAEATIGQGGRCCSF